MFKLTISILTILTIELIGGFYIFSELTMETIAGLIWFCLPFYLIVLLSVPMISKVVRTKTERVDILLASILLIVILEANAVGFVLEGRVLLIDIIGGTVDLLDFSVILHVMIICAVVIPYPLVRKIINGKE